MAQDGPRFYVIAPDGETVVGYTKRLIAERVAVEYGDGAHVVDTGASVYEPIAQRIEGGAPVYTAHGAWDTARGDADANLIEAVKKGYAPIVQAFLAHGGGADARDANGGTALIWAVARGEAEVVRLLLDCGADVNARDGAGMSALALAQRRENAGIGEILRNAGARDESQG